MQWTISSICIAATLSVVGCSSPDALRESATETTRDPGPTDSRLAGDAAERDRGGQAVRVHSLYPWWLVKGNGDPLYVCGAGDPESFLYDGYDQQSVIDAIGDHGSNCIYFQIIRSHGGDGNQSHNPFLNHDPGQGLDENVLLQWDVWFSQMNADGTVMFVFFYDDGARVWDTGDSVGPEERAFFETIVDRYQHLDNIVWIIAEEYREAYSEARIRNLAQVIDDTDERNHPVGVHQNSGLSFDFAGDQPLIDVFMIQYGNKTPEQLNGGMNSAFSGNWANNMSESQEHYWHDSGGGLVDLQTFRRKNWACGMGAAYSMAIRMFDDRASFPPVEYLEACGHQVEFFESMNLPPMTPQNDLAQLDTEYVLANTLAGTPTFCLYSTNGSTLGLDWPMSRFDCRWIDCATGEVVEEPDKTVDHVFTRPSHLGSECAVYAVWLGPPGTTGI